ncbi:SET and MYND domain-containing protein [Trypanosoma rangeli]|uniref:SET and MYND domain-containing protein n=1 Tax=Trypanosoma rangeli TaxID=5698 RepID=A0A3R7KNA7_TRYRA|nr:SET and MYND domain-containing protein [Trypanosoma rangeli]RNE98005.1 SET and MYND domain-containing protein [Trypanosoma rangeli]|eukprot:RNE98005.1 SET and MYND domain-containing protein [Trypanosoma rangeli]
MRRRRNFQCTRLAPTLPMTPTSTSTVHPCLSENCEVTQINAAMGRGVVAKKNLLQGSVVIRAAAPWIRYPTDDGLCAFCTKPLLERFFTCTNPNCHEEYCSRDSRTMVLSLYQSRSCNIGGASGP